MKLRRFNDDGIARVRQVLPEIEKTGNLDVSALIADEKLAIAIPELDSVDLDPDRTFPTTFAFCEYFHSLMKDHHPLNYRTDVGFWTWLAMVYLKQLVKNGTKGLRIGDLTRYIPRPNSYQDYYRHLLAGAYMIYAQYDLAGNARICKALLWKDMDMYGDVYEQIASRQSLVQNPAVVDLLNHLYFDEGNQTLKPKSGGDYPGAARRLVVTMDQLGMTRDFFNLTDVREMLHVLPPEYDHFNPLKR